MADEQQYTECSLDEIEVLAAKYPEIAEAIEFGVDIGMLIDNLKRPVAERIRRLQNALETFNKLQNAKKL